MKKPYFGFRACLLALISLVFSACVTINIYFPAAAAEKAADKIIEDVWQLKKEGEPQEGRQDPGQSGTFVPLDPSVSTQPQSEGQSQQ